MSNQPVTTIDNPKIVSCAPTWAPFIGFSLLFDCPELNSNLLGDERRLTCNVQSDPSLAFYRGLRNGFNDLNNTGLFETYSVCPLPPDSYHVTVWDGGNHSNFDAFQGGSRVSVEELAIARKPSMAFPNEAADIIANSDLVKHRNWGINFRYDQLIKGGNSVLIVQLAPADDASALALQDLENHRRALIDNFESKFGVRTCGSRYTPHVSLAYFANTECAEQSSSLIETWDSKIRQSVEGLVLHLDTIGLYTFTDMANFYRL